MFDIKMLENSKLMAKRFMANNGIKCARLLPIECNIFPQVMKFDSRCNGQAVKILNNNDEKNKFARKFPGIRYFLEEYLPGDEICVKSTWVDGRVTKISSSEQVNAEINEKLNTSLYLLEHAFINEQINFNGELRIHFIFNAGELYTIKYRVFPN